MKVKSESEDVQSYLTLSDPMDCSLPGSSMRGIFQARVLEWGAIAFSENNLLGFFKYIYLFIWLLLVLVWHVESLVEACKLLVASLDLFIP